MHLGKILAAELQQESQSARKMLERIPADKLTWKPHDKSMSLGQLAGHVAEISTWTNATLMSDELDFAKFDYKPKVYTDSAGLVADLDKNVSDAVGILTNISEETFGESWTMRNGEQVFFTLPKAAVMRSFVMNHFVHHRGQLSVYLRLLDIPVPGAYGPTADEPM